MKFRNYVFSFACILIGLSGLYLFYLKAKTHDRIDIPLGNTGTNSPSKKFELAKQSEPELIIFLRYMPKGADIHNHAGIGDVYSDYILDYAYDQKFNYNLKTNEFTTLPEKENFIISCRSLVSNSAYLYQFLNQYSIRGYKHGNTDGHDHFFNAFIGIQSSKYPEDKMLLEVIRRNMYEHTQYLEIMVSCVPNGILKKFKSALAGFDINNLDDAYNKLEKLTADIEIKKEIKSYLDKRDKYLKEELHLAESITGNNGDIIIRYIAPLERTISLSDFFAFAVAEITAIHADRRIVGLNLVAPEDFPCSRHNFGNQMKILDFLWRRMGTPNFTLHAGELTLKYSPVEPMRTRISESIKLGHALRIGHGISIAWEDNPIELLEYMKENKILVEICLSSNENILNLKGNSHPFLLYKKAGVPIAICTDDEGVNRSNLTMEYVKAIQQYNLTYEEVKDLIRNSIEYSFLPGLSLYINGDYTKLYSGFETVRNIDWYPSKLIQELMSQNPKLNRQVKLERELINFEKNLYSSDIYKSNLY